MKSQKRDRGERAYSRGYQAGLQGRSRDACPFPHQDLHQTWLNGWREGREMSNSADLDYLPLIKTG